jgi:hypothetical protein
VIDGIIFAMTRHNHGEGDHPANNDPSHFAQIESLEAEWRRQAEEARLQADAERTAKIEEEQRKQEIENELRREHAKKPGTSLDEVFSASDAAIAVEFLAHMRSVAKYPTFPPGSKEMVTRSYITPKDRDTLWNSIFGIHPGYLTDVKEYPTGIFGYPIGFSEPQEKPDIFLCIDGLLRQQYQTGAGNLELDIQSGRSKIPTIGTPRIQRVEIIRETPWYVDLDAQSEKYTHWEFESLHSLKEELERQTIAALDDRNRRR